MKIIIKHYDSDLICSPKEPKSIYQCSTPFTPVPFQMQVNKSSPWIWKGVSATLQSGRYTLSYPRRQNVLRKYDTLTQCWFNPLSPHDALKHHFTSLKTDLIFLQPTLFEWKFPWNWFTNTWQFSLFLNHIKSSLSTTSRELRQQFAACSGWRWQCKARLERVNVESASQTVDQH